jgi:hypothetical protein
MSIRLSSFCNHRKLRLSLYNYIEDDGYDDYYTLGNSSKINALSYSILEQSHGFGMLSWYTRGCFNNTKLSNYEYDNARYRFRVNENGDMEKRSSDCLSGNSDEWGSYYYARDKQMINKNRGE